MRKKATTKAEEQAQQAPTSCRQCLRYQEILAKAIEGFEKRINEGDFKPTVAEYLKLLQLEQETAQETAKEIKVTWIDPPLTSDSEK